MKILSKEEHISADAPSLFNFLEDLTNYRRLMPEQITNWESTKDNFRFTIPGMTDIGMRRERVSKYDEVALSSDGKVPFAFLLKFLVRPCNENQAVHIEFDADMPAMFSMMAKKPLQNLVDHMVSSLKTCFQD